MKKKYYALIVCGIATAFMLTACSSKPEPTEPAAKEEESSVDNGSEAAKPEEAETAVKMTESPEDDFEEFVSSGKPINSGKLRKRIGEKSSQGDGMFEEKPYVYVDNPSWDFYNAPELARLIDKEGKEKEKLTLYGLKELAKEKNGIIDTYNWFEDIRTEPIDQTTMHDDTYEYELIVEEGASNQYMSHILKAYDALSGEEAFTLNFDKYVDNFEYHEMGWPYIEQHIFWAQCVDNLLYVSIGHSTYASSCPYTAYIVAIDLADDFRVLWKSEPLKSNSDNFVILDDAIFTGYGFTQEDDLIYELNRFTGEVYNLWYVDSAPDYFVVKDDTLYVRTYDTNYAFELYEENLYAQYAK